MLLVEYPAKTSDEEYVTAKKLISSRKNQKGHYEYITDGSEDY